MFLNTTINLLSPWLPLLLIILSAGAQWGMYQSFKAAITSQMEEHENRIIQLEAKHSMITNTLVRIEAVVVSNKEISEISHKNLDHQLELQRSSLEEIRNILLKNKV